MRNDKRRVEANLIEKIACDELTSELITSRLGHSSRVVTDYYAAYSDETDRSSVLQTTTIPK